MPQIGGLINYGNRNHIISVSTVAFLQLYINYKALLVIAVLCCFQFPSLLGHQIQGVQDVSKFLILKQIHHHICVSSVVLFFSVPAVFCRASEHIFMHHLSRSVIKCYHLKWWLLFMYLGWTSWKVILLSSCLVLSQPGRFHRPSQPVQKTQIKASLQMILFFHECCRSLGRLASQMKSQNSVMGVFSSFAAYQT